MSKTVTVQEGKTYQEVVYDYVKIRDLPNFSDLSEKVHDFKDRCSWWELYGKDWAIMAVAILFIPVSYYYLSSTAVQDIILGVVILGLCHSTFTVKGGHAAAHGAVGNGSKWNYFWTVTFIEFMGSYSSDMALDIHIKGHHPHTNIIGLGDSSTFKFPMLPNHVYMFIAPLFFPTLTPPLAIYQLWGRWKRLIKCVVVMTTGAGIHFLILMYVVGFSLTGAFLVTWASRALLAIPYIHVNIFQHIGLPMYSQKARPKRIYQMATGVLNLSRNVILDWTFGHSIVSCHVEHHLFPTLSDNMCLNIKPLVSSFLKDSKLPYNEDTYIGRLKKFVNKYDDWMVKAPPITHFIGLQ